MSETEVQASLSFTEFTWQLLYDKSYLVLILFPLFVFSYHIGKQLDIIRDAMVDDKGDSKAMSNIDLDRLKQIPSDNAPLQTNHVQTQADTDKAKLDEASYIFAQYISEHHPILKILLEVRKSSSDFEYYWGWLIIMLAITLIGMFLLESIF